MVNGKRTLIIIPALNESGSIADVVGEVRGELPGVDVLVVDDGSTDRTAAVAVAAGARVAKLPYNLGVGGAMRLGYRYARDNDYDVAIQIDADGQHDPGTSRSSSTCSRTTTWSSAPASPARATTTSAAPPLGDGDALRRAVPGRPHQTHRHHLRLPGRQPAGHRDVRHLVPGGVPRRHCGDPGAHRPTRVPHQAGAGRHAQADGRHAQPLPARAMIYLGRAFAVLTLALIRR
ncbi:glycosyltransferase family 2 protein [Micromonospora sp. M12]